MRIDSDIPAGNGIISRVTDDEVFFAPDLRDTEGHWFYWHIRVRGAAGRTVRFHLTSEYTLTSRGPAVSVDGGATWRWLGPVDGWSFAYTFGPAEDDVRLSMAMPYTLADWNAFVPTLPATVRTRTIGRTGRGRALPAVEIGPALSDAARCVVIAARHHCCEMMQSYVLEGLLRTLASGTAQRDTHWLIIPMVDLDGVEAGDQGKNRRPHDHNRDYGTATRYSETAAVRTAIEPMRGRLAITLDLHCPWIRDTWNEHIYQVGSRIPEMWARQQTFAALLEKCAEGVPYTAAGDLPFGTAWNASELRDDQKTFTGWSSPLATFATTIEFPYAVTSGVEVTPALARTFGGSLARALNAYLESL